MLVQRRRRWPSITSALGQSIVLYGVLVLGHCRRRLTGIDPAMGCDAGSWVKRNCVRRPTSSVRGTSLAIIECMLASTGDGGGRNTHWRYILTCLLGSFINYIRDFTIEQYLIISWTFRVLAHEEDQYTVMFRKYKANSLSIALKQTKAGPRSLGAPVLVCNNFLHIYFFKYLDSPF